MGRMTIVIILLLASSAFAANGIEIKDQMDELRTIVREGHNVFNVVQNIIHGIVLVDDAIGARVLKNSYQLEKYEEPANPESHLTEYFSGHELPEVEEDVLNAWQHIRIAKEAKSLADKECQLLEGYPVCIVLVDKMIKNVIRANKEAASAGRSLFELVEQDIKTLEHAGANKFYYHGPAYQTYYNATKEFKERKELNEFFEAMITYQSLNEELLKGKANVFLVKPKASTELESILGIHIETTLTAPISFHIPYNQLIRYQGATGIKKMIAFKQKLVNAINSMETYYQEWKSKLNTKKDISKEYLLELNAQGILFLGKEELHLFTEKNLIEKHNWAREELYNAMKQEENATWLKQDKHRKDYLALSTRELQNAHSKALRAEIELKSVLTELEIMRLKAQNDCWNSRLEGKNWAELLINTKIREYCDEGDSAETMVEAIKSYAKGVKAYNLANGNPIEDTRETLETLEELLEKAEKDFDVSTEHFFYDNLIERFENAQYLEPEDALYELVDINEKAESLKEEILRKARIEYSNLDELQENAREISEDKYPLLNIERDLGNLAQMKKYYEQQITSLPHAKTKMRYEFPETPRCNQWTETEFVIQIENPFDTKTQETEITLDSIPAELELNVLSAYYENNSITLKVPPIAAKNITYHVLKGKTKPLECEDQSQKLKEKIGKYWIYEKTMKINALTGLPEAIIDFEETLLEAEEGTVNGTTVKLTYLERGEHYLAATFLTEVQLEEKNQTIEEEIEINEEPRNKKEIEQPEEQLRELDRTQAEKILEELEEACDTQVELNVTIPVEFDEKDLKDYEKVLEKAKTQEEINSIELELKTVWITLMHKSKNEIETTQALMQEKEDYNQIEWLDKAQQEYNAKHFNKAYIYAHYAKSRTILKPKQPETGLVSMNALPLVGLAVVVIALAYYYRKKGVKKTRVGKALELIKKR
ncbi:hypothetical protein K8R43_00750 [archaeon]|nr:hypothetical protein [archaeon]